MSYYEILKLEYWEKFDKNLCEKKIEEYIRGAGTDNIKQNIRRQEAAKMRDVLYNETLRRSDLAEWKQELEQRAQLEISLLQKAGVKSIRESIFLSMCGLQGSVGLNEQDMRKKLTGAGIQIKNSDAGSSVSGSVSAPPPDLPTKELPTLLKDYAGMQGMGEIRDIFDFLCIAGGSGKSREYYYNAVTKSPQLIREEVAARMTGMGSQNQGQVAAAIYTYIAGMLDPDSGAQVVEKYLNSLRYARIERLKNNVFKAKTQHKDRQKLMTPAYRNAIVEMIQLESANGVAAEISGFTREQAAAICDFWMKGMTLPADSKLPKLISVACSCGAVNNFESNDAAKKAKCSVCNTSLYTKCANGKCNALLPNSAMRCPKCGCDQWTHRAVHRAGGLMTSAKEALDKGDFSRAQRLIDHISASGVTGKDVDEVIEAYSAKFGEQIRWIDEIDRLLDQKQTDQAEQKIIQFEKAYPRQATTLNAEKQHIASLRNEIRELRLKAQTASGEKQSEAYIRLYQLCRDAEAEKWLRKTPPAPVRGVTCVCNSQMGNCMVSWTPDEHSPLNEYWVIRKEQTPPMNINDGEVLTKEAVGCDYCDTGAQPGRVYYYGVVAARFGVPSKIVCDPSPLHMMKALKAKDVQCRPMNQKILLQWQTPVGAAGVKLYRRQGADSWVCVSPCCSVGHCIDRGSDAQPLLNHMEYTYRFETVYRFGGKERILAGGEMTARPCPEIQNVKIASITPKWSGSRFSIRVYLEQAVERDVILCRTKPTQPGAAPAPGKYTALNLRAMPLEINCGTIPAGSTEAEIVWTGGRGALVPIMDMDGGWYYAYGASGILDLREPPQMADNRMNPDCLRKSPVNKLATDLSLSFKHIPQDAVRIHLIINYSADQVIGYVDELPKDDSGVWAHFTEDLPGDKSNYRLEASISKKLENGGYYLSAFAEYADGRISAAGKRKHTQSQKACVQYHFSGFPKANQLKLRFAPGAGTRRLPELAVILAPKGTADAYEARRNALIQIDLPITHDQLNAENKCTYFFDDAIAAVINDPKYRRAEPFLIVKDSEGCIVEKKMMR